MGFGKTLGGVVAAAALLALSVPTARASGGGETAPWYLDQFGGDPADMTRLYDGKLGIVMARSPRPQLYIAWRLLHGQKVGQTAGKALSIPCCNAEDPWEPQSDPPTGAFGWLAARKIVPGAPTLPSYIATYRTAADYAANPTCFSDAFDTASATLKDRAGRYGAASPDVAAWLAGQDAVFKACSEAGSILPALPAGAPAWLKADRAYQAAALALYDDTLIEAAADFAAIARDGASPWRPTGLYLRARSLAHEAVRRPSPSAFAAARAAIDDLARAPAGAFGQGRVKGLRHFLAYRDQPKTLLVQLTGELNTPTAPDDVAVSFRDVSTLSEKADPKSDMIDWMESMLPQTAGKDSDPRVDTLKHATERWTASHDVAWLIAALGLAEPGDPGVAALRADGLRVPSADPAWLTVQHHLIRLGRANDDPAAARARIDAVLARTDLSVSDRNIFAAARLQVAADIDDFARFALRKRLCAGRSGNGCVREAWEGDDYQPFRVYDGVGADGSQGFGEDARAVIDRLPLAVRSTLATRQEWPAALRLDIALTGYTRAVQTQNIPQIDDLAQLLTVLLPLLQSEWRRIVATPPGPDKRFAEFMILAKIPGLRSDLVDYTRPEGRVAEFQQYWTDWIVLAKGQAGATPRPLAVYQADGYGAASDAPDQRTDLTCLGECGLGAAPLRLPAFAAALNANAAAERAWFYPVETRYDDKAPPPLPAGAVSAWDEILTWVGGHPADPRAPEALYWLVHVGRYGGSHNHSGKRAFQLLHSRYGATSWAKRTPYFYD